MSPGRSGQGFSLLELLVVLVILVLIAAVVPPLFLGFGGSAELRSAARQVAAGLRAARSTAVLRQREAVLTVDLEQRFFRVTGDPRTVRVPADVAVKLYTAEAELLDKTSGNIRFFPDGSSTGGRITLSNERLAYTVNVDWLTGRVGIVEQAVP
jgi:general secretion pathway protein H